MIMFLVPFVAREPQSFTDLEMVNVTHCIVLIHRRQVRNISLDTELTA